MYSFFSPSINNGSNHSRLFLCSRLPWYDSLMSKSSCRLQHALQVNRPFPSSCLLPFQSESKCEVFEMVISSTLHMNEN